MLTLPLVFAAVTAGVVGGVHCVGMCGGISIMLSDAVQKRDDPISTQRKIIPISIATDAGSADCQEALSGSLSARIKYQGLLHSGRIFTYMIAGAVFGGMGAAGMLFKPYLPVQQILFVIGNVMLIVLGLRLLGIMPSIHFVQNLWANLYQSLSKMLPPLQQAASHPFILGLSWGCLPCGLLYAVAPFALLSGEAWSGAILMLLFGVSALPHLLLSQALVRRVRNKRIMRGLRLAGAMSLMSIGIVGLWYFDMKNMPSFLCLVALN